MIARAEVDKEGRNAATGNAPAAKMLHNILIRVIIVDSRRLSKRLVLEQEECWLLVWYDLISLSFGQILFVEVGSIFKHPLMTSLDPSTFDMHRR